MAVLSQKEAVRKVPALTDQDKAALLRLARTAIRARLIPGAVIERPRDVTSALHEKRGCFVSLHKHNDLRGCIGTIEAVAPLVTGVEENALNAAFKDPRFSPLGKAELGKVNIEISVLTRPEILEHVDGEDLKKKLKPGVHGVILSKGRHSATFLPQVWEQLPEKEGFLENLCRKAGMDGKCWQHGDLIVKVYQAEYFSD
ncbi:MAG: AmmeMemoRadiSam system protein A [Desulfobacterales bacterium]|nr:AmmeMemoRadiSam system protein A [Desulfobacterales bacterium]